MTNLAPTSKSAAAAAAAAGQMGSGADAQLSSDMQQKIILDKFVVRGLCWSGLGLVVVRGVVCVWLLDMVGSGGGYQSTCGLVIPTYFAARCDQPTCRYRMTWTSMRRSSLRERQALPR